MLAGISRPGRTITQPCSASTLDCALGWAQHLRTARATGCPGNELLFQKQPLDSAIFDFPSQCTHELGFLRKCFCASDDLIPPGAIRVIWFGTPDVDNSGARVVECFRFSDATSHRQRFQLMAVWAIHRKTHLTDRVDRSYVHNGQIAYHTPPCDGGAARSLSDGRLWSRSGSAR